MRRVLSILVIAVTLLLACGSEDRAVTGRTESFSLRVTDGAVDGDQDPSVALGTEVVIEVTTDTDDEVHVHGYDVLAEVSAGEPASVRFVADIPGVFDVELEGSGTLVMKLTVE